VQFRGGEPVVSAALLDAGRPVPEMDLLIASTALVHNLTVVIEST
jgi:predicted nucleic acid-binding protein